MDLIQILSCTGDGYCCADSVTVPGKIINIVSTLITVVKFGVPILLIIFGMLDLGKAVVASKEDEIKKGQQMFIKRIISAILVFFVITVVQLVVNLASSSDDGDLWSCIKTFTCGVDDNNVSKCAR